MLTKHQQQAEMFPLMTTKRCSLRDPCFIVSWSGCSWFYFLPSSKENVHYLSSTFPATIIPQEVQSGWSCFPAPDLFPSSCSCFQPSHSCLQPSRSLHSFPTSTPRQRPSTAAQAPLVSHAASYIHDPSATGLLFSSLRDSSFHRAALPAWSFWFHRSLDCPRPDHLKVSPFHTNRLPSPPALRAIALPACLLWLQAPSSHNPAFCPGGTSVPQPHSLLPKHCPASHPLPSWPIARSPCPFPPGHTAK